MEIDTDKRQRLQAVLTALLKKRLETSLGELTESLDTWRKGEQGAFEAHAEVLKHAARTERLAERIARVSDGECLELLRDAFDAELLDAAEFTALTGKLPTDIDPSPAGVDDPNAPLPEKREVCEELLGNGPVLVHLDATAAEVDVPGQFAGDPRLVLRFGYGLTPAIVDLAVDEHGIAGTLTFGGVPHRCIAPWSAVYGIVSEADDRGMVWPEDVPSAVLEDMAARPTGPGAVVPGGSEAATDSAPEPPPETDSGDDGDKPKRPHLTLVK